MTYLSIDEFFDKPAEGNVSMEEHLDEVVDLQIAVITTAVNFGRYLCMNYSPLYQDTWTDDNGKNYSTSQLFQKFNSI